VGHLEKFLAAVDSTSKVRFCSPTKSCSVTVYSNEMKQALRKLGLRNDKSHTLEFPVIKPKYSNHFIRGILDGDGSVTLRQRFRPRYKEIQTDYGVSFCGTPMLMNRIREIIVSACGASIAKLQTCGNIKIIQWSGKHQVTRILDWLYQDATTMLDRKYATYLLIKERVPK